MISPTFDVSVVDYFVCLVYHGLSGSTVTSSNVARLMRKEKRDTPRFVEVMPQEDDRAILHYADNPLEARGRQDLGWNHRDASCPEII